MAAQVEYLPLAFVAAGSPPSELIDRLMATTAALVATGDKKRRRLPGAPQKKSTNQAAIANQEKQQGKPIMLLVREQAISGSFRLSPTTPATLHTRRGARRRLQHFDIHDVTGQCRPQEKKYREPRRESTDQFGDAPYSAA